MKRLEFTCDGCDLVKHCEVAPSGNTDFMLEGWVAHHIVSHENVSPAYDVVADLCPSCTEKLRLAINPANWPRTDPTVSQFAKK